MPTKYVRKTNNKYKDNVHIGGLPKYVSPRVCAMLFAKHIKTMHDNDKPLTIMGMYLAVNLYPQDFDKYANGESERWVEEYNKGILKLSEREKRVIEEFSPEDEELLSMYLFLTDTDEFEDIPEHEELRFQDVFTRMKMYVQYEAETRLLVKGRVADIFVMKANYGWQEEQAPQVLNQTLVLNGNSADEALKMLGYTKEK